MIRRYKIQNEGTKEVLIAVGKSVGLFEAMGYTEVGEVEQAYDGRYYVAGYAPEIPAEELEARRLAEAKRIRAEQVGTIIVEVDGMPFDGGEHAQARMAHAIKASEILGRSSVIWVLANDDVATVTIEQLKEAFAKAVDAMGELWPRPYEKS
jgi:hypothetical protein